MWRICGLVGRICDSKSVGCIVAVSVAAARVRATLLVATVAVSSVAVVAVLHYESAGSDVTRVAALVVESVAELAYL